MLPLAFFKRGQEILELTLITLAVGPGMQDWLRLDYTEPENYLCRRKSPPILNS